MRTTLARLVVLTLAAAASACASSGTGAPTGRVLGIGRSPLYADEIGQTTAVTAFEAIQLLRPLYFQDRGPSTLFAMGDPRIRVYLNDMPLGGIEVLRTIPVSEVTWIRYLSPSDATMRFGSRSGRGAIMVHIGR